MRVKTIHNTLTKTFVIGLFAVLLGGAVAIAQPNPEANGNPISFESCEVAGLFQIYGVGGNQDLYSLDINVPTRTFFADISQDYQGLGYNRADNFLYSFRKPNNDLFLYRIGSNGDVAQYAEIAGTSSNVDGLDFDGANNIYMVVQGNSSVFYTAHMTDDLSGGVLTLSPVNFINSANNQPISLKLYDLAYDPVGDVFYSVDETGVNQLVRITKSGVVTVLGPINVTGSFQAINFDLNGNILLANNTGGGSYNLITPTSANYATFNVNVLHDNAGNAGNNSDFAGCGLYNSSDLALSKEVDNETPWVGQNVVFTLTVSNGGLITAENILVSDLLPNGYDFVGYTGDGSYNDLTGAWTITSLGSGDDASIEITATALTPGIGVDHINVATIVSSSISDDDDTNDEAMASTSPVTPDPGLSVLKDALFNDENNDGLAQANETISYTFIVTNVGNMDLTDVTVTDPLVTVNGDPITLLVGESDSQNFAATYTITQDDIDAGFVYNQATASGQPPYGDPVSAVSTTSNPLSVGDPGYDPQCPDCTVVVLPLSPELTVEKNADVTSYSAIGVLITYTITVENTGNVTLTDVDVTDVYVDAGPTYESGDTGDDQVLSPGETWIYKATYTTDVNDLQLPGYYNRVEVTALDPQDGDVVDSDEITVPFGVVVIDAVDDDMTSTPVDLFVGSSNLVDVLSNDILGDDAPSISQVMMTVVTPATPIGGGSVPTLDTTTGFVSVPAGTPEGTYSIRYQICEVSNPSNCDDALVTILVTCDNTAGISGQVYRMDGDIRVAITNANLTLIKDGVVVAAQVTSQNGNYAFYGLQPGSYLLQVQDANLNYMGLYPAESSLLFTDLGACLPLTHDFEYEISPLPVLGDLVWYDLNENGIQDEWYDANNDDEITKTIPDVNGSYDYSMWEWLDLNGDGRWDGPENEGELNAAGFGQANSPNVTVRGPNGYIRNIIVGIQGRWRVRPAVNDQPLYGEFTAELLQDQFFQDAADMLRTSGKVKVRPTVNEQKLVTIGANTDAVGSGFYCNVLPSNLIQVVLTQSTPSNQNADFGISCGYLVVNDTSYLSGYKFHDLNGNGAWDNNEAGLPDWTIYIDLNENNTLDGNEPTAQTDNSGFWFMPEAPVGTLTIREVMPSNWHQSYPGSDNGNKHTLNVEPSQEYIDLNFGNFRKASLSGVKFRDANKDGIRDTNEPLLAGWVIYLDTNTNGTRDNDEPFVTTDQNGFFEFELDPGTYVLREDLDEGSGWFQSLPGNQLGYQYQVTVQSGDNSSTFDFGNYQIANITGKKWHDINGNGVIDTGEPSIGGVTIYLDLNENGVLDENEPSTVTKTDGTYVFADVAGGVYHIREVLNGVWIQTFPGEVGSLRHMAFVDGGTVHNPVYNFGNAEAISITGFKWHDEDVDGAFDFSQDETLSNWTIYLDKNFNGVLDAGEVTAVTDESGRFTFAGLIPGQYSVRELNQDGWIQIYPANNGGHIMNLASGADVEVNFGNAKPEDVDGGSDPVLTNLSGNIWYDYNEDGVWDHKAGSMLPQKAIDEVQLEGWVITLTGTTIYGNTIVRETSSVSDGSYNFVGIPNGEYRINRAYRDTWVPAFPIVVNEEPRGQSHIVKVQNGYAGLASSERKIYNKPGPDWIDGVSKGSDVMYAGAYLVFDTDSDGNEDTRFFVSGSIGLSWSKVSSRTVSLKINSLDLVGESKKFGRINLTTDPTHEIVGNLSGTPGDSLVQSTITMPFNLMVGGTQWYSANRAAPELSGYVASLLPYNQKHILVDGGELDYYDIFGRKLGRLIHMEFMPLYGADFSTNQSVFGSAPEDRYPTLMELDGARHVMHHSVESHTLMLGDGIDVQQLFVRNTFNRGLPNAKNSSLENDGVVFLTSIVSMEKSSLQVTATQSGYLHAWIDYNKDGFWTSEEKIVDGTMVKSGVNVIDFQVPLGVSGGESFARFRLCQCPSDTDPMGVLSGGEVEDYLIQITSAGGTVQGSIWLDTNKNGVREISETSVSGFRVFADLNRNGNLDQGEPSVSSNVSGVYSLSGLPTGNIRIMPDLGGQWALTNIAGAAYLSVDIIDGQLINGLNFGLFRQLSTSLDDDALLPTEFGLDQNYPNPFNPTTAIRYRLAESAFVTLKVVDLSGRTVAELVRKQQSAGEHILNFDASKLASGVYVYQLTAGSHVFSKKLTLIK